MDFQSAFKKPFTDVKKLIIGIGIAGVASAIGKIGTIPSISKIGIIVGTLAILGLMINFLTTGFMLETAKMEMKKKKMLPEWTAWGDLFVKGLLAFVISAIYMLPMAIIGAIVARPLISSTLSTGEISMVMSGGIMVLLLLGLLIVYIAPSAILHYIKDGKFGAAFQFGSVFKKAFKGQYFIALIVAMIYSIILGSILNILPYVGSGFAGFISGITMFSLLGEVFPKL
ncbi:MAG: DUF4013 domain-containing protein [Nanoarchaeota archaeon]|nr:DUF4013 domain-containing protein [Nanoarchaeota archaeon]